MKTIVGQIIWRRAIRSQIYINIYYLGARANYRTIKTRGILMLRRRARGREVCYRENGPGVRSEFFSDQCDTSEYDWNSIRMNTPLAFQSYTNRPVAAGAV